MVDRGEAYLDTIRRLIELDSASWIPNSRDEHAAPVYIAFFEAAKDEVLIYCHNLKDFDLAADAAHDAIWRGVDIHIVCRIMPEPDSPFLKALQTSGGKGSWELLQESQKASGKNDFCVVDNKALRLGGFEGSIDTFASMNQPKFAKPFAKTFRLIRRQLLEFSSSTKATT